MKVTKGFYCLICMVAIGYALVPPEASYAVRLPDVRDQAAIASTQKLSFDQAQIEVDLHQRTAKITVAGTESPFAILPEGESGVELWYAVERTEVEGREFLSLLYWTACAGTKEQISSLKWITYEWTENRFLLRYHKEIGNSAAICEKNTSWTRSGAASYDYPERNLVILHHGVLLFDVNKNPEPGI